MSAQTIGILDALLVATQRNIDGNRASAYFMKFLDKIINCYREGMETGFTTNGGVPWGVTNNGQIYCKDISKLIQSPNVKRQVEAVRKIFNQP